jgi:chromosome transmission fidelity protein 18
MKLKVEANCRHNHFCGSLKAHVKTKTSEEILKSMFRCLQSAATEKSVGLRHLLSNQIMQLEFIPYINRIIAPPLRPVSDSVPLMLPFAEYELERLPQVNSQVTKPSERALLSRLVDIMVSLEMRFIEEKTEEGQMVYVLDP